MLKGVYNICECDGLAPYLFRSINAGVIIVSADTKEIRDINPAACFMIGMSKDDVIGRECKEYLCAENCDGCPVMTAHLIDGVEDVDNKEVIIYRKDGTRVYALLTINSVILEGHRLFINSLIDITKQREAENQLEEYWNKAGKMLSDNIHKLKNGSV